MRNLWLFPGPLLHAQKNGCDEALSESHADEGQWEPNGAKKLIRRKAREPSGSVAGSLFHTLPVNAAHSRQAEQSSPSSRTRPPGLNFSIP